MNGMIELTTLLQSVGFDIILIETVGVGQSEVEIAGLADTTVVVLVPEAGDEVQMMKSGLMEIAQIFVVNKSDRPDAEAFTNHLLHMMREGLGEQHTIPVIKTNGLSTARKKQLLISKLYQIIAAHQMRSLNGPMIEAELATAMQQKHFNIFTFSRKYYK
jgi:LAO/AO transport system kinase